jgi:hypothetical protein
LLPDLRAQRLEAAPQFCCFSVWHWVLFFPSRCLFHGSLESRCDLG